MGSDELGSLRVLLSAQTAEYIAAVKKAKAETVDATKDVKAFGIEAGSIGKIAGGVLKAGLVVGTAALGGLAAGLKFSIGEAIEAQEVQAQLGAVLESTGGIAGVSAEMANELATSLSGVTRFSDEAIVSAESLMLTFTNVSKDVFPQAISAALDMSTALGQSLQSSVVMLGKALNDPILGVTALGRAGVQFTVDQKGMIKSLVETGDVAAAQAIILKELETQMGGSAAAAGQTLAGQLDILKNSLGNVAEGVGEELLPVLTDFVTDVGPDLVELFERLGESSIPEAAEAVADFVVTFVDGILIIEDWLGRHEELQDQLEEEARRLIEMNVPYARYESSLRSAGEELGAFVGTQEELEHALQTGILTPKELASALVILEEATYDVAVAESDAKTATEELVAAQAAGIPMTWEYVAAHQAAAEQTVVLDEALVSLEETLVSSGQEAEIMTAIVEGLETPYLDAVKAVDALEIATRDLGDTNANILDDIQNTIDALLDYASPEMLQAKLLLEGMMLVFEDPDHPLTTGQIADALIGIQDALEDGTPVLDSWAAHYLGVAAPAGPLELFKQTVINSASEVLALEDALQRASGDWQANFNIKVTGDQIPNIGTGAVDQQQNVEDINADAAGGLDMKVPAGYSNDSFRMRLGLTSGERLMVLTEEQQRSFGGQVTTNRNVYINELHVHVPDGSSFLADMQAYANLP